MKAFQDPNAPLLPFDIEAAIGYRFRDTQSGNIWTVHREQGLLPEQVITLRGDTHTAPEDPELVGALPKPGSAPRRKLRGVWSMAITIEQLREFLEQAETIPPLETA